MNNNVRIIERKNIKLHVTVSNWEEAVKRAGGILVNNGYVTSSYVDAMVQTVLKFGPYIVIAPGLALPHARPENGVIRTGISLITLRKPINFGNADNDPVYTVIALASRDNKEHLNILKTITAVLKDKEAIKRIYKSETESDILKIFKQGEKKE